MKFDGVVYKKLETISKNASTSLKEDLAIEEMSELTKAIIKKRRNIGELSDIIEELADVQIMCEQLMMIYDVKDEVYECACQKIDRQIQRDLMEKEKNEVASIAEKGIA